MQPQIRMQWLAHSVSNTTLAAFSLNQQKAFAVRSKPARLMDPFYQFHRTQTEWGSLKHISCNVGAFFFHYYIYIGAVLD